MDNIESIQPETKSLESLKSQFPNLINSTASSDIKNEKVIIEECGGLLTVAEMLDLKDKVFEIGIHGSVPVMYLIVEKNEDDSHIVKKLYNFVSETSDQFVFENWDPHDYPNFKKLSDFLDKPEGFKTFKTGGNWTMSMDLQNNVNKNES